MDKLAPTPLMFARTDGKPELSMLQAGPGGHKMTEKGRAHDFPD